MSSKIVKHIFLYFCILTILLGIYFCVYATNYFQPLVAAPREGYTNENEPAAIQVAVANTEPNVLDPSNELCPDMLIKRGETIVLYNSKHLQLPTITFKSMDEYSAYLEKQRERGLRCPVLYLQEEVNTQGETVYRIRPTMDGTENGLPASTTFVPGSLLMAGDVPKATNSLAGATIVPFVDSSRDNKPYNSGGYYPFDPMGLHVGQTTEVDKIHYVGEKNHISDNPMDANWGGPEFSKAIVQSGAYDENIVTRPLMIQSNHGVSTRY
jgi:hypothetical protein